MTPDSSTASSQQAAQPQFALWQLLLIPAVVAPLFLLARVAGLEASARLFAVGSVLAPCLGLVIGLFWSELSFRRRCGVIVVVCAATGAALLLLTGAVFGPLAGAAITGAMTVVWLVEGLVLWFSYRLWKSADEEVARRNHKHELRQFWPSAHVRRGSGARFRQR